MLLAYISAVENNLDCHHPDIITVHFKIIKHIDKYIIHAARVLVEDSVEMSDKLDL